MAKKRNDIYRVSEEERSEFALLVKRANRRILNNMKYIQQEDIRSESAQRALMGRMIDPAEWKTAKTPFSRSITFRSRTLESGRIVSGEQAYKQYIRMLERFGGENAEHSPEAIKEGYYKSIVRSLTTLAMESGESVLLKNGRLPAKITNAIKSMNLEQLTHYFDEGDPADGLEYLYYKWEDYQGIESRDDFIDVTLKHINAVKETYPTKQQRALREAYQGTKHANKSILELETIVKRKEQRAKRKAKKKKKK